MKGSLRRMKKLAKAQCRGVYTCPACHTSVRPDDDWVPFRAGRAHRECVEYTAHRRRAA